jgi:hypothetical protein
MDEQRILSATEERTRRNMIKMGAAIALLIVPIAPAAAQQLPPPPSSAFEAPDRMPPDVSKRIAPLPPLAYGQTYGEASPYGAIPTYGRVGADGEPSGQYYGQLNAFPNVLPSGQPYGRSNGQLSNGQLSGQPYGQTSYGKASPRAIPTYGRIGPDGLPQ